MPHRQSPSSEDKEIVLSLCDSCGLENYGVLHMNSFREPIFFECLLCDPEVFEESYEKDRGRIASKTQVVNPSII